MTDSSSDAQQPLARTDFYREIRSNKLRTAVILAAFVVLIVLAGIAIDILLGFGIAGKMKHGPRDLVLALRRQAAHGLKRLFQQLRHRGKIRLVGLG